MSEIIKSKYRVRDHGEVYTPDFIVNAMLDLVDHETKRIDSKFLEPACGNGNFLIQILERKFNQITKKYKRSQRDFEFRTIIALGGIYGVDLLMDNIHQARDRLRKATTEHYHRYFSQQTHADFLQSARYIIDTNLLQGDALTLTTADNQPIIFAERNNIGRYKIKRKDYQFSYLIEPSHHSTNIQSDKGKQIFIPKPVYEYTICHFLELYQQHNEQPTQSGCARRTSQPLQGGSIHTSAHRQSSTRPTAQPHSVGLFD